MKNKNILLTAIFSAGLSISLAVVPNLLSPGQVEAQVTLNQYQQAQSVRDGFGLSRPNDMGDLDWGLRLDMEYANDPLVFETNLGDADTEVAQIVRHQMSAQLTFALGIADRLVVFAGLPINAIMDGGDTSLASAGVPPADGAGIGDPWLGARVRLLGEEADTVALGLQATLMFPLASAFEENQSYSGDGFLSVHPELLFEVRPCTNWAITANLGAYIRESHVVASNLTVNEELTYGLGVQIPLVEDVNRLDAHIELQGRVNFNDFFAREATPFETRLGLKYHTQGGLSFGIAAGPGFLRGYGTPDFRLIGSLGIVPQEVAEAPADEYVPEPGPGDIDGDGIMDDDDNCPEEAEDRDDFEDDDGCPDIDNDNDGVLDVDDSAPNEPEDMDDFEDEDGAPDLDNDGDGIADSDDQCPLEAEDMDNIQDTDGCPETDADSDSILDQDDRCPLTPGVPNTDNPECSGCPAMACVSESGEIRILEQVQFATNRDRILDRSGPVLRDVLSVLQSNDQIITIRVEGHTDDRGNDANNLELSRRRAASVRKWLMENGIAANRLNSFGCGELHPVETNQTRPGRQANRRVEFHIVDPAPEAGARSLEGCQASDDVEPRD